MKLSISSLKKLIREEIELMSETYVPPSGVIRDLYDELIESDYWGRYHFIDGNQHGLVISTMVRGIDVTLMIRENTTGRDLGNLGDISIVLLGPSKNDVSHWANQRITNDAVRDRMFQEIRTMIADNPQNFKVVLIADSVHNDKDDERTPAQIVANEVYVVCEDYNTMVTPIFDRYMEVVSPDGEDAIINRTARRPSRYEDEEEDFSK